MTSETFLDNPLFICGHRRSGTTLLLNLFDHHPELLAYPAETGFFYAVYPPYFAPGRSQNEAVTQMSDFCIKNLTDNLKMSFPPAIRRQIAFPVAVFRRRFLSIAKPTQCGPPELLRAFMLAFHQTYNYPKKPIGWIEKTTSSEIYAADILRWFPNAKFIHVVRDPRDNWASLKSGWEVRFKQQNDSIDRLMHSMIERGKFGLELAIQNEQRFGKNVYRVIRYEDLVGNPSKSMRSLCEFCGATFSPRMLNPTVFGHAWGGNNYSGKTFFGPSKSNSGRWIERITTQEANLLEFHFEDAMSHFNYPLTSDLPARIDAAVEHYKWYNYAQAFSFTSSQCKDIPAPTSASKSPTVSPRRRTAKRTR